MKKQPGKRGATQRRPTDSEGTEMKRASLARVGKLQIRPTKCGNMRDYAAATGAPAGGKDMARRDRLSVREC